MKLFSAAAFVAAAVLTQDGGTSLPPPRDVSTAAAVSVPDAGVPATTRVITVDTHAAELSQMKSDLKAMRENTDAMSQKLDATVKELEATRKQQADAQQRAATSHAAAVSIGSLDQQLVTGNTDAVEGTLQQVEGTGSLGPAARADLEAARRALANNDLTQARASLAQAAADAQAGR